MSSRSPNRHALPDRLDPSAPNLQAADAARAALGHAGREAPAILATAASPSAANAFANPGGDHLNPMLVELVAFPVGGASARLSWRVLVEVGPGAFYEMVLDAGDGRMLYRHNLHRSAGSATVFRIAPDKGTRETVRFPDSWLAAHSPVTTGNNADAYLDANGDNIPDPVTNLTLRNGRAFATSQVFDFPAPDPAASQDPRAFQPAAITNAFYFANLAHDCFYGLGFDEAAGNFQHDNGNKGGRPGDAVNVEVQDGGLTNNASMSITPDGTSPRMQLGLFTQGTVNRTDDRDFAYDGQVVFHEYTHGVTNCLVGGGTSTSCLTGLQSGALNEGWADYFAATHFNDPVQSAWLSPNVRRGIWRQSYEGYPFTYEDLGNVAFEVHLDGEIWAATLWDLRKELGALLVDRLVYTALKSTPCRPTFIDARDAILAADRALNNGANRARIFRVFARHGMGAAASGFDSGVDGFVVFNANFDLPSDIQSGNRATMVTSRPQGLARALELFTYQIQATDADGDTLRYEVVQGPQGMTVDSSGLVPWTAIGSPSRAKIVITDGQRGRVIHGFYIPVLTLLTPGRTASLSVERFFSLALVEVPANTPVLQVTLRVGQGDADITLIDPAGFADLPDARGGQRETTSVGNPLPGRWLIRLDAFSPTVSGVQLTASLPEPQLISGNARLDGRSGEPTSETFYRVVVPPGANNLVVNLEGGGGDVDLLVSQDRPQPCQIIDEAISFRCILDLVFFRPRPFFSLRFGNAEAVTVPTPARAIGTSTLPPIPAIREWSSPRRWTSDQRCS